MALPLNQLSLSPVPAPFVGARALATNDEVDYEDGGIGIQDPSAGLLYQRWRGRLLDNGEETSHILLDARTVPTFVLYAAPGITEISIAFDQNMRPVLAFVQDGIAKLRWFNPTIGEQVIVEIGEGILTPRVTMDDKRYAATNGYQLNDVILAYIKDEALCYRQQRERFETERVLETDIKTGLVKIGFNRGLRLQFMYRAT